MSKAIRTNVFNALTAVEAARTIYDRDYVPAINALRGECKGMDRDQARQSLIVPIAEFYAVALQDGERKAKGTKVLDKDAAKYEAARKALQKLLDDVVGKASNHAAKATAPKALTKAIIDQIIDSGIGKAEFNALLAAIRDGVSFK